MKSYIFYADAGHGWLAVKRNELIELGIINQVSHFSYENGDTVYLEEDCDAGLFINAMKERDIPFTYRDNIHPDFSPIRSYKNFRLKPSERS